MTRLASLFLLGLLVVTACASQTKSKPARTTGGQPVDQLSSPLSKATAELLQDRLVVTMPLDRATLEQPVTRVTTGRTFNECTASIECSDWKEAVQRACLTDPLDFDMTECPVAFVNLVAGDDERSPANARLCGEYYGPDSQLGNGNLRWTDDAPLLGAVVNHRPAFLQVGMRTKELGWQTARTRANYRCDPRTLRRAQLFEWAVMPMRSDLWDRFFPLGSRQLLGLAHQMRATLSP